MPECLGCQRCEDEATTMVTLLSGSIVCSSCPAWLEECKARHAEAKRLLKMPLQARREELAGIEKKIGAVGADRLKAVMKQLHEKGKTQ